MEQAAKEMVRATEMARATEVTVPAAGMLGGIPALAETGVATETRAEPETRAVLVPVILGVEIRHLDRRRKRLTMNERGTQLPLAGRSLSPTYSRISSIRTMQRSSTLTSGKHAEA
jgi:hypothetical protein